MIDSPISKTINHWKWHWRQERRKVGLPAEDEDWNYYVDQLPMSEVLWNLEVFEDE